MYSDQELYLCKYITPCISILFLTTNSRDVNYLFFLILSVCGPLNRFAFHVPVCRYIKRINCITLNYNWRLRCDTKLSRHDAVNFAFTDDTCIFYILLILDITLYVERCKKSYSLSNTHIALCCNLLYKNGVF